VTERVTLRADIGAVAIGASAGGIQALSVLLPALPAEAAVAVFIVLHLPRNRPSLLAEVFSRQCLLDVREAQDKEPVIAGTVYCAPANYHLLVEHGPHLALSVDEPVHHSRPSIDVLFESAAEVYRNRLLGIILTGANQDGAQGLAAVHDAGGITVVQTPSMAQAPQMVIAAIKIRQPDYVLSLDEIAAMLSALPTTPRQLS
jgi:two-component system, chemotaxis family, protein-glutamate methylesterase/glutaminase